MNRTDDTLPTNQGARPGFGESGELAAVERENLELRRELEEAKLALRNALQYALLVHFHRQSAPRAQPEAPDPSGTLASESTDFRDSGDQGGRTILRLKEELERAKAELDQLHRLLGTVLNDGGNGGGLEASRSERFPVGPSRRTYDREDPERA